jgi:hypothetical protein
MEMTMADPDTTKGAQAGWQLYQQRLGTKTQAEEDAINHAFITGWHLATLAAQKISATAAEALPIAPNTPPAPLSDRLTTRPVTAFDTEVAGYVYRFMFPGSDGDPCHPEVAKIAQIVAKVRLRHEERAKP